MTGTALVIEGDATFGEAVARDLEGVGYAVELVSDGHAGLQALKARLFDVVLLDLSLPSPSGLELLAVGRGCQVSAQFIMMTAAASFEMAVKAIELGAFDYLGKPFCADDLLTTVERARRETRLRRESGESRVDQTEGCFREIIGQGPAMARVLELVKRVAPTRVSVLITGETGTGKELVARAIHRCSNRAENPFVPVACSALPESLLESELFGHVKGAFTGAIHSRRGLLEEASGGTLFLDEISTLSELIQIKLLRVLQERVISRVGSRSRTPVDFRLVTATNVDLEMHTSNGQFREDLLYRLNVFPIALPPLRDRPEDIPLLAEHFRRKAVRESGLNAPPFSSQAIRQMPAYSWPGNVRELENLVERAVVMHAGTDSLPFHPPYGGDRPEGRDALLGRAEDELWGLDRLESEYILRTLERTEWNRTRTANILGIDRRTLYRKLKDYSAKPGAAGNEVGGFVPDRGFYGTS